MTWKPPLLFICKYVYKHRDIWIESIQMKIIRRWTSRIFTIILNCWDCIHQWSFKHFLGKNISNLRNIFILSRTNENAHKSDYSILLEITIIRLNPKNICACYWTKKTQIRNCLTLFLSFELFVSGERLALHYYF